MSTSDRNEPHLADIDGGMGGPCQHSIRPTEEEIEAAWKAASDLGAEAGAAEELVEEIDNIRREMVGAEVAIDEASDEALEVFGDDLVKELRAASLTIYRARVKVERAKQDALAKVDALEQRYRVASDHAQRLDESK